jgi:hypothetical protein
LHSRDFWSQHQQKEVGAFVARIYQSGCGMLSSSIASIETSPRHYILASC